jgi:hypothetical protein
MAQVIETYCDGCLGRGEHVPGRTYRASITLADEKGAAYDIDLCDDCAKPLQVVLEGLEAEGRKVGRQGRAKPVPPRQLQASVSATAGSGPVPPALCPVKGCDYVPTGFEPYRHHLRTVHNSTPSEAAGESLPYQCDVCEKRFATPQAVGAHRSRSHPDSPKRHASELLVAS